MKKFSIADGFTLIELLIVVSIIGVLTTLLMTNFIGIRQRARDAQRKSDLRQIQSALELYRADQGSYPLTGSFPTCGSSLTGGSPPSTYMQKIPCDPLGNTYWNLGLYYYASDGTTYTLGACVENASDADQNVTATNPGGTGTCSSSKYVVLQNP